MNINCTNNCIYQLGGKCTLDNVANNFNSSISLKNECCAYLKKI